MEQIKWIFIIRLNILIVSWVSQIINSVSCAMEVSSQVNTSFSLVITLKHMDKVVMFGNI